MSIPSYVYLNLFARHPGKGIVTAYYFVFIKLCLTCVSRMSYPVSVTHPCTRDASLALSQVYGVFG